jgi:hypothetical protein
MRHFEDMGIVSARTGWGGDESLVVFKCGPPLGHQATREFTSDVGSGHAHPDANHFVIFGGGEWLIRDDAYAWKMTDQHNTLLIDGKGQLGEGAMWFKGAPYLQTKAEPSILRAVSSPALDEITGDATQAYPKTAGLTRYVRHLLFLKPDVLIVADEIALTASHRLELRLHPKSRAERGADGAWIARGEKAVLRVESLTPDGATAGDGDFAARDREGKAITMYGLRFEKEGTQWRNVVALSWNAVGGDPVRVTLDRDGTVHAGGRSATIHWGAR